MINFKKPWYEEASLIYKPVFIKNTNCKGISSFEKRTTCLLAALITIAVLPFEETYHLANTVKKMADFPFYIFSFVARSFGNDIVKLQASKQRLFGRGNKLFNAAASVICMPIIRSIVVVRLLAAAMLDPRIAE